MIKSEVKQWFKCDECNKEDKVIHTDTIEELKQPDGWFKMGLGQHYCSDKCYLNAFDKMVKEKRKGIEQEIKLKLKERLCKKKSTK